MSFLDLIMPKKKISSHTSTWKELSPFQANFSGFGNNIYASEIVRACIRPLAIHSSKAVAHCTDKNIERVLNNRPNMYMNGIDFLQKIRNRYEIMNTVFVLISRDDKGKASGFYPVPYSWYEALEYHNGLFIKFHFANGTELIASWKDLAVLRKDYNSSDISGDSNTAILKGLELLNTANEGNANAVKSTANLRGILKTTKGMLAPELIKKQQEDFINDYINLENNSGIAALDATQEFMPISMNPVVTDANTMKEYRENIYRYFGVNDKIVMNEMNAEELDTFYEGKIAPFLQALSTELTSKVFTDREQAFGSEIMYDSNKLQFASLEKKIKLFSTVVLYGGLTVNEWRKACGMDPIDGGDDLIRRLDASTVDEVPKDEKTEKEEEEE